MVLGGQEPSSTERGLHIKRIIDAKDAVESLQTVPLVKQTKAGEKGLLTA